MKNVKAAAISTLVFAAASFGIAFSASKADYAPADAYFGRMKMSYLGINNTFTQQQAWARPHSTDPNIINKVKWADEALQDWQKRYPRDPQMARSYFLAQQMFKMLWVKEYQDKAWTYMNLIVQRYPNTFFSKTVAQDMALGFTEHYYIQTIACNPDGSEPTPPRTAPSYPPKGKLKYEVLVPPCVTPPPTPAPTPTPPAGVGPQVGPLSTPLASGAPAASALPGVSAPPSPAGSGGPRG
jgi:hypothetical protein